MKSIMSIARLGERRMTAVMWLYLFPLFAMAPILFSFDHAGTAAVAPPMIDTLWRETIIVPLLAGMFVGMCITEVRALAFSWSLPGVRRDYTLGSLQFLGVLVFLAAATHAASGTNIICGMALATLSFCTPLVISHRGTPWIARFALLGLVVIGALPGLLDVWPYTRVLVIASGICAAPWLMHVMQSAERHRESLRGFEFREVPRWFGLLKKDRPEYAPKNLSLRNGFGWTLASGRILQRSGVNSFWWAITTIGFLVITTYFFGDPFLIYTMLLVGVIGVQVTALPDACCYPLSRRTRADARFLSTVAWMWFRVAVAAAIAIPLFKYKPIPQFLSLDLPSNRSILGLSATFLICVPLLQWASTRPPAPQNTMIGRPKNNFNAGTISATIAVMIFAELTDEFARHHLSGITTMQQIGLFVAAAGITHVAYLLMLRRSYSRNDLV